MQFPHSVIGAHEQCRHRVGPLRMGTLQMYSRPDLVSVEVITAII